MNKKRYAIYFLGFLITFHLALTTYIESSFIEQTLLKAGILNAKGLSGIVFSVAFLITCLIGFNISRFLKRFGNFKISVWTCSIEICALLGLSFSQILPPELLLALFVIHSVTASTIYFNLDLFLERFSSDKDTGFIRGSYFTAGNIAFIIAPFVASLLIDGGNYWKIFSVATIIMIIALCSLLLNLSDHIDTTYEKISFFETLKKIWWNKDINHIMTTSFLLQFFYAWMTIYGLLYLRDVILLPEKTILGIIMPIALIPFVLFELFLGDIADKLFGEKEILTIGFIIMGISTITMYFATSTDLWFWAGLLFMTRVGASFVEIMNETYFYKKVDATEASLIAFYKNMKPIAFLIAPILATIILTSTGSYQSLFFILGVIVLSGTLFSATIKDTL